MADGSGAVSLLIVGDWPARTQALVQLVSAAGYATCLESGIPEALITAVTKRPAAVVTDFGAGSLDLWTFLAQLRHERRARTIPVIALLANERHHWADALSLGCVASLPEYISGTAFLQCIQRVLGDRPRAVR